MNPSTFKASLSKSTPPTGAGPALQALWWDAKGDWDKAHDCAQAKEDMAGCWVHAYLHRKEGDQRNAGYWYRRAGKPAPTGALDREWQAIVAALLSGEDGGAG